MFTRSARWYDAIYGRKDYAAEAARVAEIVAERKPGAATLLDVACGTGRHLAHLAERFSVAGLDSEPGLLALARQRLPGVPFTEGDMVSFALARRFDAVTCLFSSVGYLMTEARLHRAVARMAAHLGPGGVLLVEPWILSDDWLSPGRAHVEVAGDHRETIVRLVASNRVGDVTTLRMHYAVATAGAGIETEDEVHELRLFTKDQYSDAFTAAGLEPEWDEVGLIGRGLIIATSSAA